VVWVDERNGNPDIYGIILKQQQELCICTDPNIQANPAIYQDMVVWQDYRNNTWDIYGYNLVTEEEFFIAIGAEEQSNPVIYADYVIYKRRIKDNSDIYGYNLKTGKTFPITQNKAYQGNPAIYQDIVVWEDHGITRSDIVGYNLKTRETFSVPINLNFQGDPAIYGTTVVWVDGRHGDTDIYGYDMETEKEFRITTDSLFTFSVLEYDPQIYKDTVVWLDKRGENTTIYGYILGTDRSFSAYLFGGCVGLIGIAGLFLAVKSQSDFLSRLWILIGVGFGVGVSLVEVLYTDAGTFLFLVMTPVVSVMCGLIAKRRSTVVSTLFSVFFIAYSVDVLRLSLQPETVILVLVWAAGYTLAGVVPAWVFERRMKSLITGFSCPNCGNTIEKSWNVCPYCKANLDYTRVYEDST
jgi:beta propeller repeat protein